MSADVMTFPDTWEEFKDEYGFVDKEEVYTNGAMLIPTFRVDQWMEHTQNTGHWVGIDDEPCNVWECDVCGWIYEDYEPFYNYCPHCGAKMISNASNALDALEDEE